MGGISLSWSGLGSRRFFGAIGLCLGVLSCGGRAEDSGGSGQPGESGGVIILPPVDVEDTDSATPAGLPADSATVPESPLVPLGREWQVLFTLQKDPDFLAVDERLLYWVSTDVRHRTFFLRAAPLGGGDVVTLMNGRPGLRYLVPAGDYVYFEEGGPKGRIGRVPRAGGPDETLARSDTPAGFAVGGDALYWTERGAELDSGQLFRTSLNGGVTELLAEGLVAPQRIALHGEFAYIASDQPACSPEASGASASACTGGGIYRIRKSGGPAEVIYSGGGASDLVVNDSGVYWFDSALEQLMFAPPDRTGQELAYVPRQEMGLFASDAGALYWPQEAQVTRVPFGTNALSELGPSVSLATSVAVAGDWLYVAERGRDRIARTPTQPSTSTDLR